MKYKRLSAQLRCHIKRVSRSFWETLCMNSCDNNNIYKVLKRLASRHNPLGDNIILNPLPLTSTHSQAQAFLHHFSKGDCVRFIPYDLSTAPALLDSPFTLEELQTAIRNTRPTTPGEDGISAKFLKGLSDDRLHSLLRIFNDIFDSGIPPASWKTAVILPIRKPGKPAHQVSSYRPIALTSVLCKVFERIILRRLIAWGGQQRLFHPDHFGFLPHRDTTLALATFLNDIHKARL